jgi:hypothetical protein
VGFPTKKFAVCSGFSHTNTGAGFTHWDSVLLTRLSTGDPHGRACLGYGFESPPIMRQQFAIGVVDEGQEVVGRLPEVGITGAPGPRDAQEAECYALADGRSNAVALDAVGLEVVVGDAQPGALTSSVPA